MPDGVRIADVIRYESLSGPHYGTAPAQKKAPDTPNPWRAGELNAQTASGAAYDASFAGQMMRSIAEDTEFRQRLA
ncbi:hypothetical protein AC630_36955 [Bradyrhizobium sp. AS23.2]|nr:hypothetical protein AC630_36955 [Bradyrhizobium sp. AS23.2]